MQVSDWPDLEWSSTQTLWAETWPHGITSHTSGAVTTWVVGADNHLPTPVSEREPEHQEQMGNLAVEIDIFCCQEDMLEMD